MANQDFRRDERQRYEQRYQARGGSNREANRGDWQDEWRDPNHGYEEGGSYASRQRDYYGDEGRFRGSQRVSPGGEYVGNRAPSYAPQRYDSDSYTNQGYGENRGVSDWRTEDGLFGEPQNRGALDSNYGRNYEFEDRNAFGYGGYARDIDRGRRSALGYGGYGRPAFGEYDRSEYGAAPYGYSNQLHRGKGPKGYRRSDERIREDVCDLLSDDPRIDASNLEVTVKDSEVTLSGTVNSRHDKRLAEDLAETISGVKDVHNTVRVSAEQGSNQPGNEQAKAVSARH